MTGLRIDIDSTTTLPLDLQTVKKDLRISDDALDDVLLCQYIPSAVSWAENTMRRSIMAREHRWILADFPQTQDQVITLPRGETQSVASISYVSNSATTVLTGPSSGSPAGTDYQEDLRGHAGRLMPNQGESWPSVDFDIPAPVLITFTAGWTTQSAVPNDVKRGLTAHIFDEMELNGLLVVKPGFDMEFCEKLLSGWRIA